jgi:CheY-like chemotaxis protein
MQMTKAMPPKYVVLYADDDPDDLLLVQESFVQYTSNVQVVTARDGIEALHYLENLRPFDPAPCLIILDINMPRMTGKEALKRIRTLERFTDIPVVLFTTSCYSVDKKFAEEYKAGFITKPIDVKQMAFIADEFMTHCTDDIKKNIQKKIL